MILEGALCLTLCHVIAYSGLSTVESDNGYPQTKLSGESVLTCAVFCQSIHGCRSFGYEPGIHYCHPHTGASTSSKYLLEKRGIYVDHHSIRSKRWVLCSHHNCIVGHKCSTKRKTKLSYCSRDDHCPVLEVTNAVSSGGQEVGSTRNYTCLDGYLDTESFLTSAATTCLSNYTWSPISLNCTGPFVKISQVIQAPERFEMVEEKISRIIIGNSSSLRFFVKTGGDSNFKLCATNTLDDCYKTIIGGTANTITAIAKEYYIAKAQTIKILSCSEFRPFWVSWGKGHISIGKGHSVDRQMIINCPRSISVKSIWYSCYEYNEAVWYFFQS